MFGHFFYKQTFIKNQKTYYISVILLALAFSVLCGIKITSLKFDYDFEAFFPNEDKELEFYENFRQKFEYDNEFVLIGIENKNGIFKKDFLEKVSQLTTDLNKLRFVNKVISPTNLKTLSLGGLAPVQTKVLHYSDPDLYKDDSLKIYSSGEFVGSFFPENAKSVSIYIKTQDELSKIKSDSLGHSIEKCLSAYKFDDVHYVGRIFAQDVYLQNLQKEFVYFLTIAFALVIFFLWLSFKSAYGIIVPISIVLLSIFWTLGIMALVGKPIDLMTVMMPTMIFITGMSDVVHFFSKYFEELAKGTERVKIYPLILKEVGFPTFLTLITSIVGFLSLLFSSIKPIRDFGIYTSVGMVIAFILSYTLLPSLLYFFTPKKMVKVHDEGNFTNNIMRKGLFWIFRNQKTIVIMTLLIVAISSAGIYQIKVNNLMLDDLSEGVKIKQDFNFFDKNYSGARPFELEITVNDANKNIWNYGIIKQLDGLDEFIKKEYEAGFLYSPSSLVRSLNASLNNDAKNLFPDEEDFETIVKELKNNKKNKDIKRLISTDFKTARVSAKIQDMGSLKVKEHNTKLQEYINKNINSKDISVNITGAAHLVDLNNDYMVNNMMQGFLFSIVVIAILTFFLHKSWRMVLVFIMPNVIPLVIMAGVMGYMGIELKSATSLVFSIAFGVATDDTIHFISRLKIELGYGKSLLYAFKRTYFETGKPILLTTFILMGGFMSLMISDFQSTFYFGFLICITVIIAVLADIFLLPVLLFAILGGKKSK